MDVINISDSMINWNDDEGKVKQNLFQRAIQAA